MCPRRTSNGPWAEKKWGEGFWYNFSEKILPPGWPWPNTPRTDKANSVTSKEKAKSFTECGTVVTDMLNELLANLAKGQLIELHYGNRALLATNKLLLGTENCFPALKQMEVIWARQRKLQAFHSKHIPTLFKALETNTLEASAILRPIKKLILIEEQLDLGSDDLATWSLKNVHMPA